MQDYKELKKTELIEIAKNRKIPKYCRLSKAKLVNALIKFDKEEIESQKPKIKKKLGRQYKINKPVVEVKVIESVNPIIDNLVKEVENKELTLNKTIFISKY